MKFCLLCILLLSLSFAHVRTEEQAFGTTELVHQFSLIDFWFESEQEHLDYLANEHYKNVAIAGIKKYGEDLFVSIPRWKPNVPATLARIVEKENETRLAPFPNWNWHRIEENRRRAGQLTNETLYSVLGFEIDDKGRLWVLDQGKMAGEPALPGAIKLLAWDLGTDDKINEIDDTPSFAYAFKEKEAHPSRSFLNDLVYHSQYDTVFITDSGIPLNASEQLTPAILVVNIAKQEVTRLLDGFPSTQFDPNVYVHVNGKPCFEHQPMRTGADGIALSCDGETLYWTPLTSRTLYSVNVDMMMMYKPFEQEYINQTIVAHDKGFASDGISCSSNRYLYLSDIENSAVRFIKEDSLQEIANFSLLLQNRTAMCWPDTFGFDEDGWLYVVANNLCSFLEGKTDFTQPNFFVWRIMVQAQSYVKGCAKEPPVFGLVEKVLSFTFLLTWALGLLGVVVLYWLNRWLKGPSTAEDYHSNLND